MIKVNHTDIEKKWQEIWEKEGLYTTDISDSKTKFYNLWMFPYPSAEGLHAGHAFAGTGSDVYGRFRRMNGDNVFQPIGYDSFGIHSENYAIKIGQTPEEMLKRTTKNYERQLRSLGHGYDWTRTVSTSDPDYYKWTQWLFVVLFKAGLAYRKEASVNWCPSCKTVLADEQVIDGKCERCGTAVERKNLAQWFVKITDYADRLLDNLEKIDWTEKVKVAQKNWIGKAEGLEISFSDIKVWTRFWETIYGATFVVVSPEYLIENFGKTASDASLRYANKALEKTADERRENREKTGEDTGLTVVNPVTKKEVPVWVADYVIEGVGTGAVMGVPAHDARDFEFAKKYGLEVITVVKNDSDGVYEGDGELVNSATFNGFSAWSDGKQKIKEFLIKEGAANVSTNYHLRDWLISRQRYWGAPIPMVFCDKCKIDGKGELTDPTWDSAGWYSVPESDLPVLLPEISDFKPEGTGRGPLANHPEFFETTCPHCGGKARRETDVMDTFMDSSWYFLRYPSTRVSSSKELAFDPEVTKEWLPVDLYFGGAEHSVLHLMYARFVTQVLYDLKYLSFEEPSPKFYAHGLMIKDGAKMSKSRGNVVNPDTYIEKYGADVMRLYLMFMGPMDGSPDFRDTGIEGMERFVKRVLSLYGNELVKESGTKVISKVHETVKKVTEDIEVFHYNTAIASIMELINFMKENESQVGEDSLKELLKLLAPFAPHFTEELWRNVFNEKESIHVSSWPKFDESKIILDSVIIPVQVNGKLRGQLTVSDSEKNDEELIKKLALENENVQKWMTSTPKKVVFIPGRMINFVV